MNAPVPVTQLQIDQGVFDLYDEYCHGGMDWREFLMRAGVPYYGPAEATADVPKIKSPQLIHFAENDAWINGIWSAYEAALKATGAKYEAHTYPGTQHGFHNNSAPRCNEAAAKLSWDRTIAHFRKHLV